MLFLQIFSDRIPGGFQCRSATGQIVVVLFVYTTHMQTNRRIQFIRDFLFHDGSQTRHHAPVFPDQLRKIHLIQNTGPFQKIEQFPNVPRIIILFQGFYLLRFQTMTMLFQPVSVRDLLNIAFVVSQWRNKAMAEQGFVPHSSDGTGPPGICRPAPSRQDPGSSRRSGEH